MIRVLLAILLIATEAIACPVTFGRIKGGCSVGTRISVAPTATPTPSPTPDPGSADYAAAKSQWETNMTSHGALWCNDTEGSEAGIWYYDGVYVMDQIRAYTSDAATWDSCVNNARTVYKSIIDAAGTLAGRRAFAEGLDNVGDDSYLSSIINDVTYGNLFHNCSDPDSIHQTLVASREAAYFLRNMIVATANSVSSNLSIDDIDQTDMCTNLGNSHTIQTEDALQFVKWHATRFINDTSYVQSFMAGLTASALIEYYENVSAQAEIKTLVKDLADWLWTNAWDAGNEKFNYCTVRAGGTDCNALNSNIDNSDNLYSIDLNNLISPMYAWLYKEGEGTVYRDRFDVIFAAGVDGAATNFTGKTFSQNYRETFKAVEWRDAGPAATNYVGTFDGVDDYVNLGIPLLPATADFDLSFDVYFDSVGSDRMIMGFWSGDNNDSLYISYRTGQVRFNILGNFYGSLVPVATTWRTYRIVRSGTTLTFYENGTQQHQITGEANAFAQTHNFYLGTLNSNGSPGTRLQGRMDNVILDGVNVYNFNDGSGLVLSDSEGSNNGTIVATEGEFWANTR